MAANQVGQVEIRIVPDGSQFGPQLQAILDAAAGKASAAGQRIGQSIGGGVAPQVQMVGRTVADMNMQFDNAARKALAFTGAVMGTKAVIEGMVGKLAGVFDQLAQAQAGFGAILGERRGGELLDEIRMFAKDTPFATKQLVNYSQQLLGVGMASEKIVPLLRDTGNVIASVGGDTSNISRVLYAMSQIQTVGRLMGQDAMQLQSALIPITKLLAEYLNKSTQEVKKLQEQGRISAEQVFAAIQMAGQKVPDAMDNAVKTIAGAREVLRDSIQILLQDAPALRSIYDDVVKGIQSLAATLSSEEVSGAISRAFEAVGRAYEVLKPVVAEFIEGIGEGSMVTLKVFTDLLTTLTTVLDAIPQPVLEAFARVLAGIAVLKAPMMLVKYVQQFQQMAQIFKGDVFTIQIGKAIKNMAAAEAPAEKLAAKNERLARSYESVGSAASSASRSIAKASGSAVEAGSSFSEARGEVAEMNEELDATAISATNRSRRRLGVGTGFMVAGGLMAQSESQSMQAVGSVTSAAGMGAMAGGPQGAVAAAAAQSVASIYTAWKQLEETRKAAYKDLITSSTTAMISNQERRTGVQTGDTAGAIQNKIEYWNKIITDAQNAAAMERNRYMNIANTGAETGQLWTQEDYDRMEGAEQFAANAEAQYGGYIGTAQAELDKMFEIQKMYMTSLFEGATPDSAIGRMMPDLLEQETMIGPGGNVINKGAPKLTEDFQKWDKSLKEYGLSLAQIGQMSEEEFNRIMRALGGVDSAQQKAIASASRYNQVFEQGKLAAESLFGQQGKMAGNQLAAISAVTSAQQASVKAYENQTDAAAQLQAQQAASNAQTMVYATTLASVTDHLEATTTLLDDQIKLIAESQALKAAERVLDRLSVKSIETQQALQEQYGITNDQLLKLLGLEKSIVKNQKIVVTADVQQALEAYSNLLALQASLEAQARTEGMQFDIRLRLSEVRQAIAGIMGRFLDVPAATTGGGKSGGQSFSDKVKSAAQALENSIKSAMESVKGAAEAWKATIKDRVQYEAAVSTGRALRNVQRQATDIRTLTSGISQLKARGLTEEALTALDINAITDVRQVKRLLSASPEELKRLSTAVAQRDKLASTLASERQREENRKTITQAILEAARILGYKFTEAQAKAISAQFNITTDTDAKRMIEDILRALSGGKITSVPT